MEIKTVWKAQLRRHKGSVAGIFLLIFFIALSLTAVLTIWRNSVRFVDQEMERIGFGQMTTWVSGVPDIETLRQEINEIEEVSTTGIQENIYTEYEIGNQESDSEGQLLVYEPESYPYRIFTDTLSGYQYEKLEIQSGEIYISPSLCSMFGLKIGGEIVFPIARNGVRESFTVKGYFEDPIMGSSMIGMKSFLICRQDFEQIKQLIQEAGENGLARNGHMIHIFGKNGTGFSSAQLNAKVNEKTHLADYMEFTHSQAAMSGFMLTLQNVFTGVLMAFVVILLLVTLVVLEHSISGLIELDTVDMGILKTLGFTGKNLRKIQTLQYLTGILPGMVLGFLVAYPISRLLTGMLVTTSGILIPSRLQFIPCIASLMVILLLLVAFIWYRTRKILRITPIQAIKEHTDSLERTSGSPLYQKELLFWLAFRQILSGKKRYISVFLSALMLVFFASMVGRVNAWLGPNGEGLMNAFNPADLHIAAQPMGQVELDEVEKIIREYTEITDYYALSMPSVSVNGVDYTANVITDSKRFHLLEGKTCEKANEVVVTEFVAADLDVSVGDTVAITGVLGNQQYVVSGIYQCANDMGANIGMNLEGFQRIGENQPEMWCTHYFITDTSLQPVIMQELSDVYGNEIYLHENSWPGLTGILSAMQLLMYFLYGIILLFVAVVTFLTGIRLLRTEKKDLGIYRVIGLSAWKLKCSFTLRFCVVSLIGSFFGMILSYTLTDTLVGNVMKIEGISNFASNPDLLTILLPVVIVVMLFTAFAWLAAGKMEKMDLTAWIAER